MRTERSPAASRPGAPAARRIGRAMKRASTAPARTPPSSPASSAIQMLPSTRTAVPEATARVSTTPLSTPARGPPPTEDRRPRGLAAVAPTFAPRPAVVLGGGGEPVLTTLERKVELLGRICPELTVVVEPFTRELAALEPTEFAERVLATALAARVVVVGKNFRFGRNRTGDLATLEALGHALAFEARAEPLRGDAEGPYSSSRAREALARGELANV